jgi:subtilase family serine protease
MKMKLSERLLFQILCVLISGILPSAYAATPADLVVTKVSIMPIQPEMKNDLARISVTVKNVGGTKPSRKTSLSMSVWSVNSSGQRVVGRTSLPNLIPWYTNNIPRLDPDQKITLSKTHTFNFGGRHKVEGVIITEGLSAGEEISNNNQYERIFSVKSLRPDLVVCFKKNNKSPPHAKSTYPVRVRNIGKATAAPSDLRFRIQKKGVKHYKIPALEPGQSHSIQRSVYWASRRVSNFSLHIDSKNQVAEMNEGNNTIEGTICTQKYCATPANSITACSDTIH